MIEGFLNNVSVGAWDFFADGLVGTDLFNMNFDTNTLQFVVGGTTVSSSGQSWGTRGGSPCEASGFGFASGIGFQGLCVGGSSFVGFIDIASPTLSATPATSAVPEPTTVSLFALGLLALGVRSRRRG